jgi:hypothetical protein
MYTEAVLIEPESLGSHESSKKQAVKLLEKLDASAGECELVLGAFKHLN